MTAGRSWTVWIAVCASGLAGCGARPVDGAGGVALTKHVRLLPREDGNLVLLDATDGRLLVDTRISAAGWLELGLQFVVGCHPQKPDHGSLPTDTTWVCHQKAVAEDTRETAVAFRSTLDLSLGKSRVHCYHKGPAFTDGDCQVYLPEDQVLIVGNLIQPGRHAVVDAGGKTDLRSWARALRDLHEDFKDATRLQVVPAHGKPGPAQLLLDQADYLEQVLDFAAAAHRHGMTLPEMLADANSLEQRQADRKGKLGKALLELAYEATKQ